MMADVANGLDCLAGDLDLQFTVTRGGDSTTETFHSTEQSTAAEVSNFFLPRLDQLHSSDSSTQMTDLTNSLPRQNLHGSTSLTSQAIFGKFECSDLNTNEFHHNLCNSVDTSHQKTLDTADIINSVYDSQYCSGGDSSSISGAVSAANVGKPIEPTDVYGRVTYYDGKIVLQLRLINLNTNFPINVSECWVCRNKVHGSSHVYAHKHTFSGTFQANDEYVHVIIPESSSDANNVGKNSSCQRNSEIAQSSIDLSRNLPAFNTNVCNNTEEYVAPDDTFTLPYMAQAFGLTDSQGWSSQKPYQNNSSSSTSYNTHAPPPSGYNIHSAVDNIYSKCNTSSCITNKSDSYQAIKTPSRNETRDGGLLFQSLDACKASNKSTCVSESMNASFDSKPVAKKTETGAKKRKSRTQKKLSIIRMREDCFTFTPDGMFDANVCVPQTLAETSREDPKDVEGSSESKPSGTLPSLSPNCVDSTLLKRSQKILDTNYNLVKQIIEKTENITCKICNKKFHRNVSDFKKHMIDDHDQPPKSIFECPVCFMKFGRNKHLIQHVKTHLGIKAFKCDQCGTTYSREENLKRHLLNHSGLRPHACSVCPKTFARAEYLSAHMQAHIRTKHICEKCGVVCSSKFNLAIHLKTHSVAKPFMCELCNKSFVRSDFLDTHMEVAHKRNKPKCNICGKVFSRKDVLKRHEKMHKNITYDCKFCLKSFTRKDRLLAHKRTHGVNNELKCSKCPAAFRRRDVLLKHEKLHEQKEQCHICFKFASSKEKLVAHLNWHKKESNNKDSSKSGHMCETCGKVLTRKDLLVKHIRRVHGRPPGSEELKQTSNVAQREKSFVCDFCFKGFTRNCNLRTHVLKVHTVSAVGKLRSTNVGEYSEDQDLLEDDDPHELDRLNSALSKSRQTQSNLVDLSSWTSKHHKDASTARHLIISSLSGNSGTVGGTSNNSTAADGASTSLSAVSNVVDVATSSNSWYPRSQSVSPPPTLPGNLSLPQLSTQHPHSPINLSAEAITAAAYLLAYPSYLGPYP